MRASNLSLVIATGCCFLTIVRVQAQSTPIDIVVQPSTLTANGSYIVSWTDDPKQCFIAGVYLMELGDGNLPPSTVQTILPTSSCPPTGTGQIDCPEEPIDSAAQSATGIAPDLDPSKTYEVSIVWATTPNASEHLHGTTGPLVYVTPTSSSSIPSLALPSYSGPLGSPLTPTSSVPSLSTTSTAASLGVNIHNTTPIATSSATSTAAVLGATNDSSGPSTGAKVGIAIGVVGFALLVLIAALLIWRRSRQRQLRTLPDGMPYSHEIDSTNRDFTAEKEMHVINSPVDTLHNGYSSIPPVAETQSRSPRGSYPLPDDHAAAGAAPYTDAHPGSYGSGYEDSASPVQESQASMQPPAGAGAAIQRKPVGAPSGPTQHLREPGMSNEEVARLEEEERRLDEAIAEAERRRQLQG